MLQIPKPFLESCFEGLLGKNKVNHPLQARTQDYLYLLHRVFFKHITAIDFQIDTVHEMLGVKRTYDGRELESSAPNSPFIAMFMSFREELDQHHDRRERIVKVSRDVTALSKKM